MTLDEIAQLLIDAFIASDTNEDDLLSIGEARAAYPQLTDGDFDTLDQNSDGFLSLAELNAQLEPGTGCCEAGNTAAKLQHYLGDLFLMGVALMTLVTWTGVTRKN